MKPFVFALLLILQGGATAAAPNAALAAGKDGWQQLRHGGAIVLMRHALTSPGIGDPPGFQLDQCATQRNLSETGRRAARDIGAAFRRHGVVPAAVWSSRWCRCLDTARLAFGQVLPEPALDSMFNDDETAASAKLRALRTRLAGRAGSGALVLVTHDVNIRALTGQSLAPGEMLLTRLRGQRLDVLGRLDPAAPAAVADMPVH